MKVYSKDDEDEDAVQRSPEDELEKELEVRFRNNAADPGAEVVHTAHTAPKL